MSGGKALQMYFDNLAEFERTEIINYSHVYYLGLEVEKSKKCNLNDNEYVDNDGYYKAILKDHIAYRYEILDTLGKGTFGQVLKCYDHKFKELVAIKIIRNKKEYRDQSAMEASLLKRIKAFDYENHSHIVKMYDSFEFRHNLVIIFIKFSVFLLNFYQKTFINCLN